MPLENLLTLIEKLQERIDSHGDALRQSEALTRYALIDPLLRELGWDTEDPALVKPEYPVKNQKKQGFADYALFSNDGPIMMLEAKKLGESLDDARSQVVKYVIDPTGIKTRSRYLAVTNGACWEIYDTNKPLNDIQVASFDLKDLSAADACLKALALWRPSVISGQIAAGSNPVIGLPENQTNTTEPQPTEEITVQRASLDLDKEGWQPLSEFNPEPNTQLPNKIMFPDDSHALLKHQYKMLTKVVRWLIENGHLSKKQCPIPLGPQSKKSLVDVEPVNFDGTSFSNPKKEGSLHINTHGNLQNKIARVKRLIEHVGQDPAQFKVRLP